ncbi:RNA polymerase sigma-70 factor (ECF subfamily) [Nocardioides thalensis]|uniref:RNA polymerase sigma-70 factor (ECF subfamily) n=1 Tax=Nocardioides thalensis TaxID=1914755 RepID=A0A853C6Y4_9ACTN|nr:sigma-70 family RNA polymerase sigma factor [Nocardioides thalensis]NYJ02999.1 RNA polymerase sigma-70 factor (ECF subfamily) [Nocardioides thalensis]
MDHVDRAERAERFRRVYDEHFDAILGYALRRASADDAADLAADTFLVAWRRLGDVPEPPATRLWLYGVARRCLANQRRGARRRDDLAAVLRADLLSVVPDHSAATVARVDAAAGIDRLPVGEREVVRLATWEGLEPREIAEVLGLSAVAVRKRLSRARARLRDEEGAGHDPSAGGHEPGVRPLTATPEEGHR